MKKTLSLALLVLTIFLGWGSIAFAGNTADETVRISATDTTSGKLADKLDAGSGINVENLVTGINEKLTISTQDKLATKGDLLSHDASGDSTLAVGTAGQVLVVDSAAANGIKWGDSVDLSSPGAIGGTTPSTGEFTTVDATDYEWKGLRQIMFVLEVKNNGGTIQHKVLNMKKTLDTGGAATFVSGISGLTSVAANTPLISSSVDFANGVGIGVGGNSNGLNFDYDVTQGTDAFLVPIILQQKASKTLSALTLNSNNESINGGPAIARLGLVILDDTNALVGWNTGTFASGDFIKILVIGYISI